MPESLLPSGIPPFHLRGGLFAVRGLLNDTGVRDPLPAPWQYDFLRYEVDGAMVDTNYARAEVPGDGAVSPLSSHYVLRISLEGQPIPHTHHISSRPVYPNLVGVRTRCSLLKAVGLHRALRKDPVTYNILIDVVQSLTVL